jgi:response regulator RpfG family c-di-GMP phosphodiesterase
VSKYSRLIAEKIRFAKKYIQIIGKVAAFHDIGKIAIPKLIKLDRIYTEDERCRMQMHTIYGAQIIEKTMKGHTKKNPQMQMAYNIALHHHQIYAGFGYPKLKFNDCLLHPTSTDSAFYMALDPLRGDEIPIEGLIVSLADRYDALRHKRQYKPGFSHEKAVEILSRDDRTGITGEEWYGETLWSVFLKHHQEFDQIYKKYRRLGGGEIVLHSPVSPQCMPFKT